MKYLKHCLVMLLVAFLVAAPGTSIVSAAETPTLTMDQAIERAFTYSAQLKIDKTEIDKQEYLVDRSGNAVRYTPIDIGYNPDDKNVLSTHEQNQFNLRKSEKKLEADKRQLIIDVQTAYYAVIKAQKNLEVSQLNYKNSQVTLLQAEEKYKAGVITKADLLSARAKVQTDQATIVENQNKLDEAYTNLNKLVGYDISSRPQLVDGINVTFVDFDPESKANIASEASYETWSAEEVARVADRIKIFATYYDVADWNVEQSEVTASDTKQLVKKQTRALVLGLDTLKSKHDQYTKKLEELQAKLKVAKANFAVGMVTKDVVQAAELAVAQTEAALMEVDSQYNITVNTILKLTGELPTDPAKTKTAAAKTK